VHRRTFLATTAAATGGVAGCLDRGPPDARVAFVWLTNDRDESYTVDVTIEDDGQTVFERTYELGPAVMNPDPPSNTSTDRPVEGYGQYVVSATMDGETLTVDTTEHVDGDEDCVGVRFRLLNNGGENWWARSYQRCSSETDE